MDSNSEPETKLISLITQLMCFTDTSSWIYDSKVISFIIQIISLVRSMDLASKPKPESKLISLINQTISLVTSMDLDFKPKPKSKLIHPSIQNIQESMDLDSKPLPMLELISLISKEISKDSDLEMDLDSNKSLVDQTLRLEPEPELIILIHQIFSFVISMDLEWKKLISFCPAAQVTLVEGKFHVVEEVSLRSNNKWHCLPVNWERFKSHGEEEEEGETYFRCRGCNGDNYQENKKAPVEIKQKLLHPKHSLKLVLLQEQSATRKCYCCDQDLLGIFYSCSACDSDIRFSCVEKPPVLYIDHLKWHEHRLALFPRQTSLTCNLCTLDNSTSAFYTCPPCNFVAHRSCISLPHVIRISRHYHRISYTSSFDQGDWSCGVCRTRIDNDYGVYSCIKGSCSYAVHSKCATQSNVWDGVELEGEPEDIEEEEVEPFVKISDGIIQHFRHQHHHLRLDENIGRDYDENKQCQACVMPIYTGNFYSCMQCDFILHEDCAKLSRKIHHPIHPHILTLVGYKEGVTRRNIKCSACPRFCTAGFFYGCSKKGCRFKLHVQCTTISEPLVHESHMHPLFLTSKPGEYRRCWVCQNTYEETFNFIECGFALCFGCATLPQKVKYKHDKHMLTLSYGKVTTSMSMTYWCEVCEERIDRNERFYMYDESCCVTLHVCLGMKST
ncbi:Protein VACUOLELESS GAMETOPHYTES [Cardamine amara subsp. amara]|uniref:Protein VACUOLELESS GAMETOPHYTES n=1 Tax=Cardamine amara subsp. amara TaxID=228776 RepID=A0ABD1BE42_CARAN